MYNNPQVGDKLVVLDSGGIGGTWHRVGEVVTVQKVLYDNEGNLCIKELEESPMMDWYRYSLRWYSLLKKGQEYEDVLI